MNRSHLLSLAYLAFGLVTFVELIVDTQNGVFSVSLPGASLSTLLLLIGSVGMTAIAVGTFVHPKWFGGESITFRHLLAIWGAVLLIALGVGLELTTAIL